MNKIIDKIWCFFGFHQWIKWSEEKCHQEQVIGGVFAPKKCSLCGKETQKMKW